MRQQFDKRLYKIVARTNLSTIQVLISKALITSATSHGELDFENDMLKEYNDMRGAIKHLKGFNLDNI